MRLSRALLAACSCAAAFAAAPQTPPSLASPPPSQEVLPAVSLPGARADAGATPLGLSVVWRVPGRKLDRGVTGTALNAFSPDGRLVAVYDATRVRVLDASSGTLVRDVALDPSSVPPSSLAVSSSGVVALGKMGNAEVLEEGRAPVRHWCVGACGTLASIAFSPDDRLLAYQGTRGAPEWRSGLGGVISVIDLGTGMQIDLEAVASIAQVSFSPDGQYLYAMNVTQLDDRQSFGVRIWSAGDWRLVQSLPGSRRTMRRVAPLAGTDYAGVTMNGGNIEARDLGSDRVLWSVPLMPPALDAPSGATNLDLVEIAPSGKFVLSYEASTAYDGTGFAKGTLVIRRSTDGGVEALYDVVRISHLSIAPDSRSFVYSTASGQTYTALARVPL